MSFNILCLHGCGQNMIMFKQLMKNLAKIGSKYNFKFFYMEAKYDATKDESDGTIRKTWYREQLNLADIGVMKINHNLIRDVMDDIDRKIEEHDISVLLGYSQGGNVVDTYLSYRENNRIKCAIIMAGYSFVDENKPIVSIPVLSIISKLDMIVPTATAPLINHVNITIMEHNGGHNIITSKPKLREICEFIYNNTKS